MIKAVFLDWFNTLAQYDPPREEIQGQALQELGINVPPERIRHGLIIADSEYFEENARSSIQKRSPEEQAKAYARYQKILFTEAGVNIPDELFPKIMGRLRELYQKMTFILFEDVLPALKTLKEQKLTLGLLTNLQIDMNPICQQLGLEPYLDFIITSGEVGADKPQPPIFAAALERAKVNAPEAVHVGDQYKIDVLGARGLGIAPILIDRADLYPEVNDCPRIHSLTELTSYLD